MTVKISLTDVPVFAGLSKKERKKLDSLTSQIQLKAGSVIARQGERGREFAVVLEGVVHVTHDGETIAALGPGDFFGEMSLLGLGDTKRSASVIADTDVTIEVMSVQEFNAALHELPEAAAEIGRIAARRAADNA